MTNEETQDKLKDFEEMNAKLKTELQETTEILVVKGNELSNSKAELVRHRQEIDVSPKLSFFSKKFKKYRILN